MNLPAQIEIEINSHCNRSCDYCPNSVSERVEQGEMKPELFHKIIDELSQVNYTGKISYMFYNEPLLSRNFFDYSRYAWEKLPLATFVLYSNGSKITDEAIFYKIDNSIDHFIITKHHQEKDYPFEKVFKKLPEDKKAKINFRTHKEIDKYNRAGLVDIQDKEGFSKTAPCHVPSLIMTISLEGNVISCFEDYNQNFTLGNVTEKPLSEIWNSEKYIKFRNDLLSGKRELYKNCSSCNRMDLPDITRMKTPNKHFIDQGEENAVLNVLRAKNFYRYQKTPGQCEQFEQNFNNKFGYHGSVLINSGTNALVAALMALNILPGDEVIIPSYTYIATASSIISIGAIPVVANIDQTLTISPEEVKKLITEKTRAVIAVHMDGLCCDLDSLVDIAEKYQLKLIEDTAQALGGKYKGRYLGSIGDIGCFSLNRDKNLTTGEGGIVATKDPVLYERLLCICDHGYSFNPLHQNKFKEITPFLGLSMRVSELTGAMANIQLSKLDKIMEAYTERKSLLTEILNAGQSNDGYSLPPVNDSGECHTALHISFSNPKLAAFISKKLMSFSIDALPITLRPAHAVWKWGEMITTRSSYHESTNSLAARKMNYHKINFMPSIQLLSSTLKFDINPELSQEETKELGIRMDVYMRLFIYRYNNQNHKA
jgi:8-amino-3,8-dideoxy-alpha-D-manno-octulosonate transaminase